MTQERLPLIVLCVLTFAMAGRSSAQTDAPAVRPIVERQANPPEAGSHVVLSQDARETRKQLEEIFRRLPPNVGRVLRIDPSLMRNQSYLATYPVLAAFLQQRPDVVSNPGFYLANVFVELGEPAPQRDSRTDAVYMWRAMIQNTTLFACFLVVTAGILWIIRALLDWRRWSKAMKVQAEVQNKLLDRFTASDDLLNYLQTPAGHRLIDSAPMTIEQPSRPVGAPLARILWSVQAGLVLAAGATGLLFVSRRVVEEVGQVLFGVGVLALALGAGFVVSAAASFLLSQRLGLLDSAAREHSHPTGA